jgi:hypothetical protein
LSSSSAAALSRIPSKSSELFCGTGIPACTCFAVFE